MRVLGSLVLGYLMGCISPSALLCRIKHVNLKEEGTGNLGASNVVYVIGRKYGFVVMVIDILKAYCASKLARFLFPKVAVAGLVAGLGAILGHIFPFTLGFEGGRGLAALGGTVLAFDMRLLAFYVFVGMGLMLVVNKSVFLPMFVSVTFPIIVLRETADPWMVLVSVLISAVIIWRHWDKLGMVDRGEEGFIRDLIRDNLFHNKKGGV